MKKLKPNTFYKFDKNSSDYKNVPPQYFEDIFGITEKTHSPVLFCIGEITNMPGHYAIAGPNGLIRWGFHPELFKECEEDDL